VLLGRLRKEIRSKESELQRLKQEEARLSMLTGRARSSGSAAVHGQSEGRINWRAILGQLPKQFKASDVRHIRRLKDKRPSEIFAAVTRWIDAGLAKRKTRGLYERIH
jgi:hypothetical protein